MVAFAQLMKFLWNVATFHVFEFTAHSRAETTSCSRAAQAVILIECYTISAINIASLAQEFDQVSRKIDRSISMYIARDDCICMLSQQCHFALPLPYLRVSNRLCCLQWQACTLCRSSLLPLCGCPPSLAPETGAPAGQDESARSGAERSGAEQALAQRSQRLAGAADAAGRPDSERGAMADEWMDAVCA